MHGSTTGFYDSNRREYTIRRGDVLVPSGHHVSLEGQDSLVIHNSIGMDDGQVGAATSPFFIPHLMVRVLQGITYLLI